MEGPADEQKVDGRSLCHTKSWRKVPQMHGKLTEGPAAARKLIEVPVNIRKVDRRSRGHMEI